MRNNLFLTLAFGGLFLLVSSCQKISDLENLNVERADAEYALPLVNTNITLNDIFGSKNISALRYDANGNLILHYESQVGQKNASDFFTFFSNLPFIMTDSLVTLPYKKSEDLDVKKIRLKKGSIRFGCNAAGVNEAVKVTFTLPQLTKNSKPFVRTYIAQFLPGTGAFLLVAPEDVSGYELNILNDSIYLKYEARIVSSGKPIKLSYAGGQFENIEFGYVEAIMKNREVDVPSENIEISLFNNFVGGNITFADPTITLEIDNSFGFPIGSLTRYLRVRNVKGDTLSLKSSYVNNTILFDYPTINEPGKSRITTFVFNNSNSNIKDILNNSPTQLSYDIDAKLNPQNNSTIGFMTDSSRYKIRVQLDLPLYGTASNFVGDQDFKIDLSKFSSVRTAEFKIVADNKIPVGINTQFYFKNQNGVVLDSMFKSPQPLTAGANVNANADATGEITTILLAAADADKMNRIRTATSIGAKFYFSTTDKGSKNVRVNRAQGIKIRMGVKVGV